MQMSVEKQVQRVSVSLLEVRDVWKLRYDAPNFTARWNYLNSCAACLNVMSLAGVFDKNTQPAGQKGNEKISSILLPTQV